MTGKIVDRMVSILEGSAKIVLNLRSIFNPTITVLHMSFTWLEKSRWVSRVRFEMSLKSVVCRPQGCSFQHSYLQVHSSRTASKQTRPNIYFYLIKKSIHLAQYTVIFMFLLHTKN